MEGEFRDPIVQKVEGYRVVTMSGSLYEVLPNHRVCRRLNGQVNPTPRQGPDGQWKPYVNAVRPEVGEPMLFDWDGDGIGCTLTSNAVKVDPATIDYVVP